MGVTGIRVAQRDQFLGQIDRLAGSHALHSSESLCKLLRYLARQAVDHPAEPLKEYQIATEVFGRPPDFDPQLDSTIRVQAGRLRTKLAEYYTAEGTDDPIVVELPKGTYHLAFHHRAAATKGAPFKRIRLRSRESRSPERSDGLEDRGCYAGCSFGGGAGFDICVGCHSKAGGRRFGKPGRASACGLSNFLGAFSLGVR